MKAADSFVAALAAELGCPVAADGATRAAYATDASNHRVLPRCVAFPRRTEDVVALVDFCRGAGVPLTSRGGGTGLAGSALGPGVVADYSRHFNRVVHVDADTREAVVEPGAVLDTLQRHASPFGLRFGPDPATHSRCTIGGMVGTNSCGARALAWGTTAANVRSLDVVLADGSTATLGRGRSTPLDGALAAVAQRWEPEIRTELGRFPRQVSGYALQHLLPEQFNSATAFVGSEGTWGQVVRATLGLVPLPARRMLVVAGFASILAAAAAAPQLAATGVLTVEGMGVDLIERFPPLLRGERRSPDLPAGNAWLFLEVGGTEAECRERAEAAADAAEKHGSLDVQVIADPDHQRALWAMREHAAGVASRAGGVERWPGWEDAAVPPERLADYLADFTDLLRDTGRSGSIYGHFGEGCVHVRIDHDLLTAAGRRAYADFQARAADLVVAHAGSLSGEHGDGRQRSELLARMYSADVRAAFAAAKAVFDPGNLFNPGLIVDPVPLSADLRLALNRPLTRSLAFAYPDDGGDFAAAARRCVGVGACRSADGGMCPSYQATLDERHSTRGRARVLFEMIGGSLSDEGWQSDDVRGALDLCLMCKACASECPVSVDMATYKAEFLHHYYADRKRPRSHLSLGWAPVWLALGRRAPAVTNAVMRSTLLSAAMKRLAGIEPRRDLPQLARVPARRVRPPRHEEPAAAAISASARRFSGGDRESMLAPTSERRAILWLDTFTKSFAPEVVADAAAVLQAAGIAVETAGDRLCCGLTWVSTGQLGVARVVMAKTVATLDATGDGAPVVVLEPSCGAALRDDAVKLLDTDAARRVASRVRTLAEVVADSPLLAQGRQLEEHRQLEGDPLLYADGGPLARRTRDSAYDASPVIAQFHCHQRAVLGTSADRELLTKLGYAVTSVDEGCCGLAGNFGFEPGHWDVSSRCAELSFLPYLERMPTAQVLCDGFSCRLQMQQLGSEALGDRQPVHLATLLRRRLDL